MFTSEFIQLQMKYDKTLMNGRVVIMLVRVRETSWIGNISGTEESNTILCSCWMRCDVRLMKFAVQENFPFFRHCENVGEKRRFDAMINV